MIFFWFFKTRWQISLCNRYILHSILAGVDITYKMKNQRLLSLNEQSNEATKKLVFKAM